MNINVVGGLAAVIALAAIFTFGHKLRTDVTAVIAVKAPVKVEPQSAPYHRVERGGLQGPEVACASVTPLTEGKSPAELAAFAKQYEVSLETLKGYFVCIN